LHFIVISILVQYTHSQRMYTEILMYNETHLYKHTIGLFPDPLCKYRKRRFPLADDVQATLYINNITLWTIIIRIILLHSNSTFNCFLELWIAGFCYCHSHVLVLRLQARSNLSPRQNCRFSSHVYRVSTKTKTRKSDRTKIIM
jgi:hypothetical protein